MTDEVRFLFVARELEEQGNANGAQGGPEKRIGGQLCCLLFDRARDGSFAMLLPGAGTGIFRDFRIVHGFWMPDHEIRSNKFRSASPRPG